MKIIVDARPEWLKREVAAPRCWIYEANGERCGRGKVVGMIPGIGYVCAYHGRNHDAAKGEIRTIGQEGQI